MKAQQAYGQELSVQAIAGTHVVLFGFDVPKENVSELMGLAVKKTDTASGQSESDYLPNFLLDAPQAGEREPFRVPR